MKKYSIIKVEPLAGYRTVDMLNTLQTNNKCYNTTVQTIRIVATQYVVKSIEYTVLQQLFVRHKSEHLKSKRTEQEYSTGIVGPQPAYLPISITNLSFLIFYLI